MNVNGILDVTSLKISAFFMKNSKYFREGIESKSILEHLENVVLEFPEVKEEGFYELSAKTLIGAVKPAFCIAQWKGKEYPTIIYHHGASEEPYDFSFNKIFPYKKKDIPANLIVIRGPFCSSLKEFLYGIRSLSSYVAMLAVSVKLYEHIIQMAKEKGSECIIATGVSLGGVVANLHHTYYNSADIYKPLLAGPAIDEALLNSAYSGTISSLAKENKEQVSKILNFEKDFMEITNDNVYPLLGRYDQVMKFEKQKRCYKEEQIAILEKGHFTGSISFKSLYEYILKDINPCKTI